MSAIGLDYYCLIEPIGHYKNKEQKKVDGLDNS